MSQSYEINKPLLGAWTWMVLIFVLAPLIFVFAVSLTPLSYISLPTTSISFRWYAQLAERPEFIAAGINSVVIALQASLTALLLGACGALACTRYRFPLRNLVRLIAASPLFIPMVMSGLSILVFLSAIGWYDQASRLYFAHSVLTLPYVFRTVSASLAGYDINQELAARNLGAGPLKAFILVTFPQVAPGFLAGAVFAFIVSFDNVGVSIFLTGAQFTTLPVELFNYASYSNDPMTAALSVVMILVSLTAIWLLERFFGLQRLMA